MTLGCNICGSGTPTPDRLIPPGWTVLEVSPTRFLVACAECSARYQIPHTDEGGVVVAVVEDHVHRATRFISTSLIEMADHQDLWTGCSVHVEC